MPDWRELLDSETIGAWDLKGRDYTLVITKVQSEKIRGTTEKAKRKALISFKGAEKKLVAGATILNAIGKLYGRRTEGWIGKPVTLYATTCVSFGESGVPCVRVRPVLPKGKVDEVGPSEPVDREMQAKQKAAAAHGSDEAPSDNPDEGP